LQSLLCNIGVLLSPMIWRSFKFKDT